MTEKTREQLKAEIKEEMLKEELKKEIEQEEADAKIQAEIEAIREEIRVLREEDADVEKRKKQADRMADYKRIHKQLKELLDRANTPEEKKMIQELITENVNRVMSNGKALLIFIVLVVVVVGGVWSISTSLPDSNNSTSTSCSTNMKEVIKKYYKSPSTVDIIHCTKNPNGTIVGEADAQNGFGATVRSSFICTDDGCEIFQR